MVETAKKRKIGIDDNEGAEEKIKPISTVGGGQGGSLTAFTQGSAVGHGR
jgi:hypothetical protein